MFFSKEDNFSFTNLFVRLKKEKIVKLQDTVSGIIIKGINAFAHFNKHKIYL
jgi:hypothetical protein